MGGQEDGDGAINADKLIYTIKEEFEMTIDIEKLIEEIDEDGSGQIEFDEFTALLSGAKPDDDDDEED
jgi:Ca2+-binding EF-hand superfamily protein